MMAETVLLRVKRRGERWLERPVIRAGADFTAYFGGGLLLSALAVWGRMQPVAMGLTAAAVGWRSVAAAAGSAAGYVLFWGREGVQGAVWALGAMLLALLAPTLDPVGRTRLRLAAGCMCLVSGTGLAFGLTGDLEPEATLLRICLAGGSALLAESALVGRNRLSRWLGWGVGVMAVAGRIPWLGWLAAGFAASAAPLPAVLAAALGAELGAGTALSLTAAAGLAFYLQRLLPKGSWQSFASPCLACAGLMLVRRVWEPWVLVWVGVGAGLGALLPWQEAAVPRRSSVGAAQVRLEQTARALSRLGRHLLEYTPASPDIGALTQQLKQNACGSCSARAGCLEQKRLTDELVAGEEGFQCRKAAASNELRRSREQLRRIRAARARQEEYRMALVQQYGFLSDTLQELSDRLPDRGRRGVPRYRVQVSARSRGRQTADGDRVSAFPGVGCRYYVMLCDGMGTGPGAAEESRRVSQLMMEMLTAGMSPGAVLGSINSQLTLTDRGGAVAVDLAELRLDTGRVWLYKWGAVPSWLLRRSRGVRVGSSGPPPGLGVTAGRESVSRVVMYAGDSLVLLSDGVDTRNAGAWAAMAKTAGPGELAAQILETAGSQSDDATAVVIRLQPHGGRRT